VEVIGQQHCIRVEKRRYAVLQRGGGYVHSIGALRERRSILEHLAHYDQHSRGFGIVKWFVVQFACHSITVCTCIISVMSLCAVPAKWIPAGVIS
jgi:hypothetical protein